MAGEEWARHIIQNELGVDVISNDDNSVDSMYDLRVGNVDKPDIAIEVTGAVNSKFTETWNVACKDPLYLSIAGDWIVEIQVGAPLKPIRKALENILKELEEAGKQTTTVDHWLKWNDGSLFDSLDALRINWAHCARTKGSGKVHLTLPGIGGGVDEQGGDVARWIGDFLRDPTRQDNLHKLHLSSARERHIFVILSFSGVPWIIESYFSGDLKNLPQFAPDLPSPVTGVWIASGLSGKGLRWDGNRWIVFENIKPLL